MATGLVIHISSGKDKHTQVLTDEHVRIGTGDDCGVRLRSSSLPKRADEEAVLELERRNGSYVVSSFDSLLDFTLNGKSLESNHELEDGDETGPATVALVSHQSLLLRARRPRAIILNSVIK